MPNLNAESEVGDDRTLAGRSAWLSHFGLGFGFPSSDFRRVRQFHHVVEKSRGVVAADMEDVHLAFVRAGDRLELLDAVELAFVRAVMVEGCAIDDLHRAKRPMALRASQTSP